MLLLIMIIMGVMITVMTIAMLMMMTIIAMMIMDTTMIKTPLSSAVPDRSTLLQLNHAVCSRGEETIQDIFDFIIFSFPKNDNYRNLRYRVILMLKVRAHTSPPSL